MQTKVKIKQKLGFRDDIRAIAGLYRIVSRLYGDRMELYKNSGVFRLEGLWLTVSEPWLVISAL